MLRPRELRAIDALKELPWAKRLIRKVIDVPSPDQGTLFELRFAHEIARCGIVPVYGYKTGVGGSDVDFRIPSELPWNIELVSVDVSQAVNKATVSRDLGSGIRTEELFLGLRGDADERRARIEAKQTGEHEMLRFISNLEKKVYSAKTGKPIKFPLPSSGAINMLLVDARFFEGWAGGLDRDHCRQMVFSPGDVSDEAFVYWSPTNDQPIRGLWDPANDRPGAIAARERIHVIGFVHEEEYTEDEIREVTVLFFNPHLPIDSDTYPLRWDTPPGNPRTALRQRNALWNRNQE